MNMYDPKYWKHGENITVEQFCDYLKKNIPSDAVFYVCGDNRVSLHYSPDGNVFSVDCNDLSDLSEYEECSVEEIITEESNI